MLALTVGGGTKNHIDKFLAALIFACRKPSVEEEGLGARKANCDEQLRKMARAMDRSMSGFVETCAASAPVPLRTLQNRRDGVTRSILESGVDERLFLKHIGCDAVGVQKSRRTETFTE